MTAIVFVFLPSLYAVIEKLQYALAWFGVLIAMDLWVGRNKGAQSCIDFRKVYSSARRSHDRWVAHRHMACHHKDAPTLKEFIPLEDATRQSPIDDGRRLYQDGSSVGPQRSHVPGVFCHE